MSNWESTLALFASAAHASSNVGAAVDLGTRDRLLRQTLAVTAASGTTPTLAVRLECSADGATGWRTFASFALTAVAVVEKITAISPERWVRAAWTIGGALPSFTFAVAGTRGICFANLEDLDTHGMPPAALSSLKPSAKAEGLAATTVEMCSILSKRYDLPIVVWDVDIVKACCKWAVYDLLSVRGFNPDGSDENVRKRYCDARDWVEDVAASRANPINIVDSTPDVIDDGAVVVTLPSRGWR